ncbi:MAG: hypothetical protein K5910_07740 [Bacteroidales bacterium]|nr:hypothetical protein [Bacteroidales bacterium]
MKKNLCIYALAASALLLGGAESCSKLNEMPEPVTGDGTYHMVVEAGLPATRAAASKDESGVWTLVFSEGDELFVRGDNFDGWTDCFVAGTLTMKDGSLSADGKKATFEGDLQIYYIDEYTGEIAEDATIPFTVDPLADCETNSVTLIPGGFENSEVFSDYAHYISYNYDAAVASDVKSFLEQCAYVTGTYDAGTGKISLNKSEIAILNCSFDGLQANTEYFVQVSALCEETGGVFNPENPFIITTDADGVASFVTGIPVDFGAAVEIYMDFIDDNDDGFSIILGPKTLEAAVYNVSGTGEVGDLE